jgi:putative CocE/NonD family hydrolase
VLSGLVSTVGAHPPQNGVTMPDLRVAMTDGVSLATDVYLPDGEGPFPVVLSRSPYDKRQFGSLLAEPLASAGYAVVMQDVRGMGGSEGLFIPFLNEKQDGLQTLDWIAEQPWCDGNVGAWGPSYVGFCALILSTEGHETLKAVVNVSGWGDTQEMVSPGGAMHLMHGLPWTLSGQIRGTGSIADFDWPTVFRHLPVTEIPRSLGIESGPWEGAVRLFTADALMESASVKGRCDAVTAPVLHLTGWYDFMARHTLDTYEEIGAATQTRQKLLVGPWHHDQQWGRDTRVGDADFGAASVLGVERVTELSQHWFDRWLKRNPNGIDTREPVRLFVMGVNEWRTFEQWPPRAVELQKWYFASEKGANGLGGDGRLTTQAPTAPASDAFVFDPLDPVPTTGGVNSHFFHDTLGVRDQRPVEERTDVLVYTSAPLERDLTLIGPLQVVVHASTEGRHTDVTAKLCAVRPDGYALPLEDGIRRGPDGLAGGEGGLMEPGRAYRFTVDLGATGIQLAPGHRLRVELSSSNFPKYTRNPNTGETPEWAAEVVAVEQTVLLGPDRPSYIVLPVLRAD